ncbi:hypothetical protein AWB76_01685 [Caballeronia temeraria]|uniref:DUF4239 domain-containing protein n=1 Tax=Caballeronia temeraria TaxID=1777137 RepID=A0A158A376_9BURK|nr:DUF4239 domain-containing protein [Caballeronia temeraria]SAK52271.1 hypothetical protein AWB76_01685 [Caballeronia temeraria]
MTSNWLHNLPLWQMTLVVFGATGFIGALVHYVTGRLAASAHRRSFATLSPGLLSPIGVIFGLLIAFTAAQVWNDTARANDAVDAEAGALRSVIVLSAIFPADAQMQLRKLVRDYIEYTVDTEWPMMAQGAVTLKISPPTLNRALQYTLALPANTAGQQTAQRQVAEFLERALEARRERILVSRSEVSGIKWLCLSFLAFCLVFSIALVHGENRLACAVAIGLFCASLATTMLLILSHDRPFSGEIAVKPEPLLQVVPVYP